MSTLVKVITPKFTLNAIENKSNKRLDLDDLDYLGDNPRIVDVTELNDIKLNEEAFLSLYKAGLDINAIETFGFELIEEGYTVIIGLEPIE